MAAGRNNKGDEISFGSVSRKKAGMQKMKTRCPHRGREAPAVGRPRMAPKKNGTASLIAAVSDIAAAIDGRIRRNATILTATGIAAGGVALVLLALYYPSAQRFFPPCPMYRFLHLHCPGCGSTRAVYCLLHGDPVGFFRNNPMLLPTLIFSAMMILCPWARKHYVMINCFIAVLVLYAVLRNVPVHPFTLLQPVGISEYAGRGSPAADGGRDFPGETRGAYSGSGSGDPSRKKFFIFFRKAMKYLGRPEK